GEYGSSYFSTADLIDPKSLAQKLHNPQEGDSVSRFIAGQLQPAHLGIISNYTEVPIRELKQALTDDLNRIIRNGPLYDQQRFASVALSQDTTNLLAQNPQAGDLVRLNRLRLNRLLLLDAYSNE